MYFFTVKFAKELWLDFTILYFIFWWLSLVSKIEMGKKFFPNTLGRLYYWLNKEV